MTAPSGPVVPEPVSKGAATERGVTQTLVVGQIEGVPGNCVQAAVATLLSLPIEAVPHFLLFDDWNVMLSHWLGQQGLDLSVKLTSAIPPVARCIVAGTSPRGIKHVCVAEHGQIVWDPHPSRGGLSVVDEVWIVAS